MYTGAKLEKRSKILSIILFTSTKNLHALFYNLKGWCLDCETTFLCLYLEQKNILLFKDLTHKDTKNSYRPALRRIDQKKCPYYNKRTVISTSISCCKSTELSWTIRSEPEVKFVRWTCNGRWQWRTTKLTNQWRWRGVTIIHIQVIGIRLSVEIKESNFHFCIRI